MAPPTFTTLPSELHLEIVSHLEVRDINRLLQTSRHFWRLLDQSLHQRAAFELRTQHARYKFDFLVNHDRGATIARLFALGMSTAPPPYQEHIGIRPLDTAALFGKPAVLGAYLDAGVGTDMACGFMQSTLLHAACMFREGPMEHFSLPGAVETVRLLLQRGCDVDREDAEGKTALQVAVDTGCAVRVLPLLAHGADPRRIRVDLGSEDMVKLIRKHYPGELEDWSPTLSRAMAAVAV